MPKPKPEDHLRYTTEQAIGGLLKTDIAVIGENATHAVLAVRVSRRWLAQNHDLIAMLSDVASGAD
jgi:hypothetical protein